MNEIKRNRIAFFGDSLTEGIPGVSFFTILKERLPDDNLLNYGKGGDTVIALYKRIKQLNVNEEFDIVFLWIGTNDIFVKVSGIFPVIKTLLRQPWTKNTLEFSRYYRLILEWLSRKSKKIVAVSPLFLGEDLENTWNRDLKQLSEAIQQESKLYENVSYLNLRDYFTVKSSDRNQKYVAKHALRVALDALLLKQKEQVDKKSFDRGLQYTLDGVHLNSRGAALISDIFYNLIISILNK